MKIEIRLPLLAVVLAGVLAACGGRSADESMAAAQRHLAANDLPAAIIELKNVLRAKPEHADARFLLGKALLERDEPIAAGVELEKALELGRAEDETVPLLADALVARGEMRKLVERYKTTTLGSAQARADLATALAMAHAQLGDAAASRAAVETALAAQPEHGGARLMHARHLWAASKPDEALAAVDAALRQTPKDAAGLQLRADLLLFARQDYDGAVAAYKQAIAAHRSAPGARGGLIAAHLSRGNLAAAKEEFAAMHEVLPRHAATRFHEARIALHEGDINRADLLGKQAMAAAPDSAPAMLLSGAIAYRRNELSLAEKVTANAMQAAPEQADVRLQLARIRLRMGDGARALEALGPLLKAERPLAPALSLAGMARMQVGDYAKAQELFTIAVKVDPTDPQSRMALALARISQGDAGGFRELDALASADAGTHVDLALVNAHLGSGQLDAALKAVDRIEKKLPDKPLPFQLRGQLQAGKGDVAAARTSFERALAVDPAYFPAAAALAEIDLRERQPTRATQRFEALLKTEPKNVRALLALATLHERLDDGADVLGLIDRAIAADAANPMPRLAAMRHHLDRGDTRRALEVVEAGVKALPDNTEMLEGLSRVLLAAGQPHQALDNLNRLVQRGSDSPAVLLLLAQAQLATKANDSAAETVRKALRLVPDSIDAHEFAGRLHVINNRLPDARAKAKEMQTRFPRAAQGWALEGDIEAATKNWNGAVAAYRNALRKNESPVLAERLHVALRNADGPAAAELFAVEWRKAHPSDASFLLHLALWAIVERNYTVAESYLTQAVAKRPKDAGALNNLAWVLAVQKKPGAVERAEQANQLEPNQPQYMDTLAMAMAGAGRLDEAVQLQQRALQVAPDAHALRLRLAELYVRAGDTSGARRELDTLARLGSGFGLQKEVRALRAKL
jgi:putative PEP-CTERM system TPR-repeat lipoprotein